MSGHLFVTRGDLRHLACDAWLLPTGVGPFGRYGHVGNPAWLEDGLGSLAVDSHVCEEQLRAGARAALLRGSDGTTPAVWAGHSGDFGRPAAWYAEPVTEFIREAAAQIGAPLHGRERPLLGVPLLGTGAGGIAGKKGAAILAIVEAIAAAQRDAAIDVALVLPTGEAFSATQKARARVLGDAAWTELDAGEAREATRISRLARSNRLVLFLGAGLSMSAGLDDWKGLLRWLGGAAGLDDTEIEELLDMDPRDSGRILVQRLATPGSTVDDLICSRYRGNRVSLAHTLLASLPVDEVATTNYDTLFEQAWREAGRNPAVLPNESAQDAECWLLKLHGTVAEDPAKRKIVLSRDQYLRLEGERGALAGIIQAMLITRHMLFVGYSLSDDNFHRIVHQVRSAVGEQEARPESGAFGTVLTPSAPRLAQELWQDDVEFVSTYREGETSAAGRRRVEILLDRVAADAAAPLGYLLDDSYEDLFDDAERALRGHLKNLRQSLRALPEESRRTVEGALDPFGDAGLSLRD